jgi:transcriptional regulator with XRE-family HTH domain
MTKLADLRTAADIHEQDMRDLEYRREYERTRLANDVAIKVLCYRTEHGLSQSELGRMVGMRQPHIARLESGEHEPSLSTLARLSTALGLDFSVDVKPGGLKLRYAARSETPARRRALCRPRWISDRPGTSPASGGVRLPASLQCVRQARRLRRPPVMPGPRTPTGSAPPEMSLP